MPMQCGEFQELAEKHVALFTCRLDDGTPFRKFSGFGVGPGWMPIVSDMLDEMSAEGCDPFIEQIALGGGNLEVLTLRCDDRAEAAIRKAEERADCTCGQCGGVRDMEFGEYDWAVGLCRSCLADLRRRDACH